MKKVEDGEKMKKERPQIMANKVPPLRRESRGESP